VESRRATYGTMQRSRGHVVWIVQWECACQKKLGLNMHHYSIIGSGSSLAQSTGAARHFPSYREEVSVT
jgi:hypothetical protein